jgi:hypothetical protein
VERQGGDDRGVVDRIELAGVGFEQEARRRVEAARERRHQPVVQGREARVRREQPVEPEHHPEVPEVGGVPPIAREGRERQLVPGVAVEALSRGGQ